MNWQTILGRAIGTALLGLEEATAAITNEATIPTDVSAFVTGFMQIWGLLPANPTAAPNTLQPALTAHAAKTNPAKQAILQPLQAAVRTIQG